MGATLLLLAVAKANSRLSEAGLNKPTAHPTGETQS